MTELMEFLNRYCVSMQIQPIAPYGRNKNRVILRYFNPSSQQTEVLGAPSVAAAAWRACMRSTLAERTPLNAAKPNSRTSKTRFEGESETPVAPPIVGTDLDGFSSVRDFSSPLSCTGEKKGGLQSPLSPRTQKGT